MQEPAPRSISPEEVETIIGKILPQTPGVAPEVQQPAANNVPVDVDTDRDRQAEGGGPEAPRGPRPPEYKWGPEFRAERWDTVERLLELYRLVYTDRYKPTNREQLKQLFQTWKKLEAEDNKRSYESKAFNAKDLGKTEIVVKVEAPPKDDLADLPKFSEFIKNTPLTTAKEIKAARDQLSRYFNEAKRMGGLLTGVDESLKDLYVKVMYGMESVDENGERRRRSTQAEIMEKIITSRTAMTQLGERAMKQVKKSDLSAEQLEKFEKLEGVWDTYADMAIDRFALLLNGGGIIKAVQVPGEFEFNIEDVGPKSAAEYRRMAEEGEIYWRPTWANYYEVTARTEKQFRRAVETFIRWMRTGLGKSPDELVQKINGFKEALTAAGSRTGMEEVTVDLRLELEALMGVIGASHSNEQYNANYFQQFWSFIAKDQGPDRMLHLIRTARGVLAALLWKFDKDPRFELLFSPHGARGELMGWEENASEMLILQRQILDVLIAETMGISMKTYHPDDPKKIKSDKMYQRNLKEITKFKSDDYFKNMYEGFDGLGDQKALREQLEQNPEIQRYKQVSEFGRWVDEQYKKGLRPNLNDVDAKIYNDWKNRELFKQIEEMERNIQFGRWVEAKTADNDPPDLTPDEQTVYEAYKAGEFTLPVSLAELEAWERLEQADRIQQHLKAGKDPDELDAKDKIMYEEAKNVVTLAYELYGAMGEKAERGGGVFMIDRMDANGEAFQDFMPVFWAQRLVHFADNWTKATYGGELDENDAFDREIIAKLRKEDPSRPNRKGVLAPEMMRRTAQARRLAVWALKAFGYEAKLWDFTLLKNGKPVDINTLGYTKFGINRNKQGIERFRYAVPENSRILGYNSKGDQIILVFDDTGKPMTLQFDKDGMSTGKIVELEHDKKGDVVVFDAPSGEKRKRLTFDNLNVYTTRPKPMFINTPTGELDPVTHQMKVTGVNKVSAVFSNAIKHIYARSTGHPYWGYQEEDRGLISSKEAFHWAKAIKKGEARWEDAPPHAVQLLMADPTLARVERVNQEDLECAIFLAAVEESYYGHWRIGTELYQNFFPADASRFKNRVAYVLQDHGGSTKELFHARAKAAYWIDANLRRARTFLPHIVIPFQSMAETWGAPGGALDVFRMMGYEKYRMVGQFATDKWVKQIGGAQDLKDAYFDWYDEQKKKLAEGLGRKLNNEADNLRKFYKQFSGGILGNRDILTTDEAADEEFLQTFRGTLNRPEVVMNRTTVLASTFRGERAPLLLEGIEIYERLPDGSYVYEAGHKKLSRGWDKNRDSGSSRHINNNFVWNYVRLARSDEPGEGQELYAQEAMYYELGDYYTLASIRIAREARKAGDPNWERHLETRWEWYNGKANN